MTWRSLSLKSFRLVKRICEMRFKTWQKMKRRHSLTSDNGMQASLQHGRLFRPHQMPWVRMQSLFVCSAIYTIAVYVCTEKTVFIAGVSHWPSWEISFQCWYWLALWGHVSRNTLSDMFHRIVIVSSVVVYSMFHLRINYKQRWGQPSPCFISLSRQTRYNCLRSHLSYSL
jgi:hypothetical protein